MARFSVAGRCFPFFDSGPIAARFSMAGRWRADDVFLKCIHIYIYIKVPLELNKCSSKCIHIKTLNLSYICISTFHTFLIFSCLAYTVEFRKLGVINMSN